MILIAALGAVSAALLGCHGSERLRMREKVLETNLHTMRDVIGQFHHDRGRYPESMGTLVDAGYLLKVPLDPFTRKHSTWTYTRELIPGPDGTRGIVDVHSGAPGKARSGVPLSRL